jgi:hypothetical protein
MKREEQVAIGKWIDETWPRGPAGSPQNEFRMTVNLYAQSGDSRTDAAAKALASTRERHPGFTPVARGAE